MNRYDKPSLLFNDARQKYGDAKWVGFMKALYRRFVQEKKATTALFLDEMGKQLGPGAKESFSLALYAKRWNGTSGGKH